jgi:hypothetical protein
MHHATGCGLAASVSSFYLCLSISECSALRTLVPYLRATRSDLCAVMLRGAARRLRPASARALLAGAPEQPLARSCAGFHASPSAFADDVPRNSLGRTRNPLLSTTGICLVPQQSVFVVERLGRFNRVLEPGLHLVIPVVRASTAFRAVVAALVGYARAAVRRSTAWRTRGA